MTENDSTIQKATRKKRRGPGTDKPERKEFAVRLEAWTFERLNLMLLNQKVSRNEYIAALIEFDLAYRDRIAGMNTKIDVPPDPTP